MPSLHHIPVLLDTTKVPVTSLHTKVPAPTSLAPANTQHHRIFSNTLKVVPSYAQKGTTDPKKKKTKGALEVGAVYGTIPFTSPSSGPTNAFAKGHLMLVNEKLPIGIVFDLGTDQPMRGQRNSIRFQFDTPKLLHNERWQQARAQYAANTTLDSLKALQSAHRRMLSGTELRLKALRVHRVVSDVDEPFHVPSLPDSSIGMGNSFDAHLANGHQPTDMTINVDTLDLKLEQLRSRQTEIDSLVQRQEQLLQRQQAITASLSEKRGTLSQVAQGIRRLDIGTCAPNSSEFLLNGITFQGISFEYAHKDLFLAIDHGRSFDDTWQNNDPLAHDLRRLHQSLFLSDVQDLNPRKLTSLKTGFGTLERSHVHFGYLYGRRKDLPFGVPNTGSTALDLVNHVIEVDAGHVFFKNHSFRAIYARSLTIGGLGTDDVGNTNRQSIGDLFTASNSPTQAVRLRWSSDLQRTGTLVTTEARSIGREFQSFGMGFIRNGSRALELSLEQRLGKALKVRTRGTVENRQLTSSYDQSNAQIQRAAVSLLWKPTRSLNIRCNHSPSWIANYTSLGVQLTKNTVTSLGGGWLKRWQRTTGIVDADITYYDHRINTTSQQVWNTTLTVGMEHSDRWQFRLSYTALERIGADTLSDPNCTSLSLRFTPRKLTSIEGSLQLGNDGRTGWTCTVRQRLGTQHALQLSGVRLPNSINYLSTFETTNVLYPYTWTFSFQYQW